MQIFKDSTKTKVVAGFGLALSVVVFAVYLTYTSFTQLLTSVEVLARPNNKLVKLQHTLANIATAESSIRAYTLTTKDVHFDDYLCQLDTIKSQIKSLRLLMQNSPQELAQVDSIAVLLQEKEKSLELYLELKKQQRQQTFSGRAMREIASTATEQPLPTVTTIKQHTTTTITDRLTVTTPKPVPEQAEKKENKSLFGKIFSKRDKQEQHQQKAPAPPVLVPQLSVTKEVKVDTSAQNASQVAPLAKVRRILHNVQRDVDRNQEKLLAKELALLQQDKNIMDQIRDMMYKLERHEANQMAQSSTKAKQVAKQTAIIILVVGLAGLAGGIAFILLILRDITRSNIYKSQLKKGRKEALQLARAKEAFLANMSHEIRTPLNVVLGFSEQLNQTPLQPQQQQQLQAIRNAGEHLLHIVNDVLDLSKIEAGKLSITQSAFNLPQLLSEVEQAFALKANAKDIGLKCTTEKELNLSLLGDALRLKQVLFNLVDNAIKFTDEGQVQVHCKLKSQRRNKLVIAIDVSDTGIGIPEEQAKHVFGEFNQADDSIIRKYGGTGLGLSISKKLVEIQQGSLTLQSTPGKGTVFTIILPFSKAPGVVPAKAETATTMQQQQVLKAKRVLVIDDDSYSRTLCELILSKWEMQVTLAPDGKTALQLVDQQLFDVILTDIQLPGMSGKAVARTIHSKNNAIPVIALTANILSKDSDFFANTGISDYLLKPFTEEELQQKLLAALKASVIAENSIELPAATTPDTATALYNLAGMRQFTGTNVEALASVLEVLLQDNQESIQKLKTAAANQDWQTAGNIAHKMLTAFKHLQAYTITPALEQLEQALHQENLNTAQFPYLVAQVETDVQQVMAALEQELKEMRTSVAV